MEKPAKIQLSTVIQDYKPFLSLPFTSSAFPSLRERISSCILAFIPWLIVYETFIFIGAPVDAIITNLPIDGRIPIWEFTEVFYISAFLFSVSVPFVIKTRRQLRNFITDIWFIIVIVGIIYAAFPLIVKQRAFIPQTSLGHLILFARSVDGESGALPSCHVIWAFVAALYFTESYPRFKWIWYAFAVLISMSCLTTGAHTILDEMAGFCTFIIVLYRRQTWHYVQRKISPGYS